MAEEIKGHNHTCPECDDQFDCDDERCAANDPDGRIVLCEECANDDDSDEWNEWSERYTPIKNHLDDNASGDGFMFETYGPEVEFVKAQPSDRIWTLIDADGREYVIAGWHWVNRLGYFITTKPFADESESYRY